MTVTLVSRPETVKATIAVLIYVYGMTMKTKLLDIALIVVIVVFSIIIYGQVQELLLLPSTNEQKHLPQDMAREGLYEPPEAAATISKTQEGSGSDAGIGLPNLEMERAQAQESPAIISGANESQQMRDFILWCKKRGIKLVGTKKTAHDLYFKGAAEKDFLPIADIANLLEVAAGLYEIPEPLLEVMEGKTFYLSNLPGRGTVVTASWPDKNILVNVDRGVILEQRFTKRQTIHEFAHILDFHGIQGIYKDQKNYWPHLKKLREEIFAVPFKYDPKLQVLPPGYMDVYSTANAAENFAQHFMYYILYGNEFRKKAQDNVLLQKKYDFFRKNLFIYQEYGV